MARLRDLADVVRKLESGRRKKAVGRRRKAERRARGLAFRLANPSLALYQSFVIMARHKWRKL